jgi:hypothetical protein
MSSRSNSEKRDNDFRVVKWQLTVLSGALTTGVIIMLQT